jgi:hypothetical protein
MAPLSLTDKSSAAGLSWALALCPSGDLEHRNCGKKENHWHSHVVILVSSAIADDATQPCLPMSPSIST